MEKNVLTIEYEEVKKIEYEQIKSVDHINKIIVSKKFYLKSQIYYRLLYCLDGNYNTFTGF